MIEETDDSIEQQPAPEAALETQLATAPIVVDDEADESERGEPLPYPVVGIGASAGGVEAYIELFSALAPDTGMAFVVIPHLLATHKSHLVDILSRHTPMPVSEIVDGTQPEADHIYILPPNTRARLERGLLQLEARPLDGIRHPIDYFFRSLATAQKTRAIGVVLSGRDADGALGLKAIKGEGGISIVQSPESARFAEMPRSSISIDHVDRVLAPSQIAIELEQLGRQFHQSALRTLEEGAGPPGEEQHYFRIVNLLRGVSGIDFRSYKPTTIRRRIARRMLLHRIHNLADYALFLQNNPKELRELQEDALINVTRFFRDPGVFETLKSSIFPRMFEEWPTDQQVRIWVAGCSSGEEAYSIAICLLEYLSGKPIDPSIQIFGTDASDSNIHKARVGIFPESVAGEISPERLRRFFIKVDKGYQISKRVRDLCIFARQNLSNDPPFSKMDLISCRNVLIYLGAELQKQILPTFHYALRPHGYLLLGTSETIREFTDLFHLVDRRNKFFVKVGNNSARISALAPHLFRPDYYSQEPAQMIIPQNWGDVELQRAADRIVLARYGPPGVIVNERLEIIQSRGHTAPFLEMPPGAVTLQLNRMLRESLASTVSQAVRHAVEQDIPVRVESLRIDGNEREITLEVLPIHTMAPRNRCFLVLFGPGIPQPSSGAEKEPIPITADGQDKDNLLERLRQDLGSTKLYLQTLLEERESRNQELISANEEIQSSNEEMQSTNEELETTKEELQSSNEELQTINDELQQRNTALSQTSNDLSNLLNSVNLPVIMLNSELNIRHFTPAAQRLMNLREPDIGRPFNEIRLNLTVNDLEPIFNEVLETLTPREIEVQDREERWYLLRVRPYRTAENRIDGLVVVLLDVDQLRRHQQELQRARDFARSIIESVPLPLAVVDLDLKIRTLNEAFQKLAGFGKELLERRSITELASAAWGLKEPLRSHLEDLRISKDFDKHFEFEHRTPGENARVLNFRGRFLKPDGDMFVLVTIEETTAYKEMERLLSLERERLSEQVASTTRELGQAQEDLRGLTGSLFTSKEDEGRRVARELHDDICQKLAVLEIDTQKIEALVSENPDRALGDLEQLRTRIGSLAEDVRLISHTLHPSMIDDLGLPAAIRSLAEDFREREQMIVTFTAQHLPEELPRQIGIGLYRITQEALWNVAKHAGRTHVKIVLEGEESGIRLQVMDYGDGFDIHAHRPGLGLISMEERARMLHGTFSVASEPHHGTRVTVFVPCKTDGNA